MVAVTPLKRVRRVTAAQRLAALVDVETTGLHRYADEVVELAVILFSFDPETGVITGIVDDYVGLRDPGRPIPPGAISVHGITDQDVRGKRLDDERIRMIVRRADFFVAHNATFDQAFVERLYPDLIGKPWLCSMNGVPWRKMGFRSRGLQNLLRDQGIKTKQAHRGGSDALATLKLLHRSDADGVPYFKWVLKRYADRLTAVASEVIPDVETKVTADVGAEMASDAGPETVPEVDAVKPRRERSARRTVPWPLGALLFIVKAPFVALWWVIRLPFTIIAWPFRRSRGVSK